ncbi:MAG: hypothetical protein QM725_02305 [Lacibacter sp.]
MKTSEKILYWIPRLLCIAAILFVSIFAFDSFSPGTALYKQILAFLIHLIPSFLLTALLVFAWKKEFAGGILFIILGIAFSVLVYNMNYARTQSAWISLGIIASITLPFIVVGVLFIVHNNITKRIHI